MGSSDKSTASMVDKTSLHSDSYERSFVSNLIPIEEAQRISDEKNYSFIRKRLKDESLIISNKIRKAAFDGLYSAFHIIRDLSERDIERFKSELASLFPYYDFSFQALDCQDSIGDLSVLVKWHK